MGCSTRERCCQTIMHIFKGWEKHLTHYLVNQREKEREKNNNYNTDLYVCTNTDEQTVQLLNAKRVTTMVGSYIPQHPQETHVAGPTTTIGTSQGPPLCGNLGSTSILRGLCSAQLLRLATCSLLPLLMSLCTVILRSLLSGGFRSCSFIESD